MAVSRSVYSISVQCGNAYSSRAVSFLFPSRSRANLKDQRYIFAFELVSYESDTSEVKFALRQKGGYRKARITDFPHRRSSVSRLVRVPFLDIGDNSIERFIIT